MTGRGCSSLNLSEGGIRLHCEPLETTAIQELLACAGRVFIGFRIGTDWFRVEGAVVSVRCRDDGQDDVRISFVNPNCDEVERLRRKLLTEFPKTRVRPFRGPGSPPGTPRAPVGHAAS